MTKYDTPRDRGFIDRAMLEWFLLSIGYYGFDRSVYYNPALGILELKDSEDGDAKYAGFFDLLKLFDISEDHELEFIPEWEELLIQYLKLHPEQTQAIEKLKSFATLTVGNSLTNGLTRRFEWSQLICRFLKNEIRDDLTDPEEGQFQAFAVYAFLEYTKDLDKFYVPTIEV